MVSGLWWRSPGRKWRQRARSPEIIRVAPRRTWRRALLGRAGTEMRSLCYGDNLRLLAEGQSQITGHDDRHNGKRCDLTDDLDGIFLDFASGFGTGLDESCLSK